MQSERASDLPSLSSKGRDRCRAKANLRVFLALKDGSLHGLLNLCAILGAGFFVGSNGHLPCIHGKLDMGRGSFSELPVRDGRIHPMIMAGSGKYAPLANMNDK